MGTQPMTRCYYAADVRMRACPGICPTLVERVSRGGHTDNPWPYVSIVAYIGASYS